jgi:hypothetical protein
MTATTPKAMPTPMPAEAPLDRWRLFDGLLVGVGEDISAAVGFGRMKKELVEDPAVVLVEVFACAEMLDSGHKEII